MNSKLHAYGHFPCVLKQRIAIESGRKCGVAVRNVSDISFQFRETPYFRFDGRHFDFRCRVTSGTVGSVAIEWVPADVDSTVLWIEANKLKLKHIGSARTCVGFTGLALSLLNQH